MIRSTVNATTKTIVRDPVHVSQSVESTNGDKDMTEKEWDAAKTASPVHSNEHWDGTNIKR